MNDNNDIPTGCAPFDLEKALAGEKVLTRIGEEVTQIHLFKCRNNNGPLHGVVNDLVHCWGDDGCVFSDSKNSELDLFMVREIRFRWVVKYPNGHETVWSSHSSAAAEAGDFGGEVIKFEEVI